MTELTTHSFTFVISLAAVVNGLGIVRLLSSIAEYVRNRDELNVRHYWVFSLFMTLQLLVHVLLWWSLWGLRGTASFNFLIYMFVLAGPTLVYLATSVLMPDTGKGSIDLQGNYYKARPSYFTLMSFTWIWALLIRPVVDGTLAPSTPVFLSFLVLALVSRFTDNPRAHGVLAVLHWVILIIYIAIYGMQLGGQMAHVA